ncbi:hypothetical protein [Cohnella fermenti]|uniref:Uncharacterized protein n=1 Tax=Cohnella fermenti TaxID=2565925 RepID=A0A4S4BKG4_9BACL|nr:hypothetical protein [Cohnella fermenti]THF72583.1 hypothetical protein E6C55_32715 [Cohnella fermenti]
MNVVRKYYKWIAMLVVVALVAETFVYVLGSKEERASSVVNEAQDDGTIAADISNMTGATTEDILKLKRTGMNWNEVLEKLKQTGYDNSEKKEQRTELLAGTGIEETMTLLVEKGFSQEEITEARMLAERLQFQLKELSAADVGAAPTVSLTGTENKGDESLQAILKMAEQFDLSEAVYNMVLLKKEFGSYEAVLDEYLLSLQIEVDLQQYMSDKEAYLKAKQEKSAGLAHDEIVTSSVVETALLEKIQRSNRSLQGDDVGVANAVLPSSVQDSNSSTPLPDVPQPVARDVKPANPADQVMREIEAINPNR